MAEHRYLVALGSNVRHPRHGPPAAVLRAACGVLDRSGLRVEAASPVLSSAPLGPSRRRYANAAAVVRTSLDPAGLLARLKAIEVDFGRRPGGMRWRARVLDLDIVLWSGGRFLVPDLVIPHPAYRQRAFVLLPALRVARDWRDPITHLTLEHLAARLTRPRPALRGHTPAAAGGP